MVIICAKRIAKGWCELRLKEVVKSSQCPFSITGRRNFFPISRSFPLPTIQYIKAVKPPVTTK